MVFMDLGKILLLVNTSPHLPPPHPPLLKKKKVGGDYWVVALPYIKITIIQSPSRCCGRRILSIWSTAAPLLIFVDLHLLWLTDLLLPWPLPITYAMSTLWPLCPPVPAKFPNWMPSFSVRRLLPKRMILSFPANISLHRLLFPPLRRFISSPFHFISVFISVPTLIHFSFVMNWCSISRCTKGPLRTQPGFGPTLRPAFTGNRNGVFPFTLRISTFARGGSTLRSSSALPPLLSFSLTYSLHSFALMLTSFWDQWFKGGITNICYNCLDTNIAAGNGEKIAIYWEGNEPGVDATLTYNQLLERVCQVAFLFPIHCYLPSCNVQASQ